MKNLFIVSLFFLVTLTLFSLRSSHYAANSDAVLDEKEEISTTSSPFEGAWELYSTESGGTTTFHKAPKQITVFANGYLCQMDYEKDGKFSYACAGFYEWERDQFKVTFTHHSYEPWIGVSMWWKWSKSANGDTLYYSGPSKILKSDGEDITWKEQKFEKKVRVK